MRRRRGSSPTPSRSRGEKRSRSDLRWAPGSSFGRWAGIALIVALVAFGAGYGVAAYFMFPAPATAESGVPVPSLVGLTLGQARAEAEMAGLAIQRTARLPSIASGAGIVLAQSPLAGQHLRAGATVEVAVSAAAPRLRVPAVVGFDGRQAEELLRRLGFEVVRREILADEPVGRVIRVEPPPGTERTLPARIRLIVSAGPPTLLVPGPGDSAGADEDLFDLPPILTDTIPVPASEGALTGGPIDFSGAPAAGGVRPTAAEEPPGGAGARPPGGVDE